MLGAGLLAGDELVEIETPDPIILEKVDIFHAMPWRIRHDLLRKVRKRIFRAGRVVCRQNEAGDGMSIATGCGVSRAPPDPGVEG